MKTENSVDNQTIRENLCILWQKFWRLSLFPNLVIRKYSFSMCFCKVQYLFYIKENNNKTINLLLKAHNGTQLIQNYRTLILLSKYRWIIVYRKSSPNNREKISLFKHSVLLIAGNFPELSQETGISGSRILKRPIGISDRWNRKGMSRVRSFLIIFSVQFDIVDLWLKKQENIASGM